QTSKRHDVDRLASQAEDDDRGENGQRNRGGNDQRASPVSKKDKDHHGGQAGRDQRLANDPIDRSQNKDGLIGQWLHLQLGRNRRGNLRKNRLDARDHGERRGVAGLLNREQNGALPVHTHHVSLRRKPVAHPGHIFHVNRGATQRLQRDSVQFRDRLRRRIGNVNVVLLASDFRGARGEDQILQGDCIYDVQSRKTLRLQRGGVEI